MSDIRPSACQSAITYVPTADPCKTLQILPHGQKTVKSQHRLWNARLLRRLGRDSDAPTARKVRSHGHTPEIRSYGLILLEYGETL